MASAVCLQQLFFSQTRKRKPNDMCHESFLVSHFYGASPHKRNGDKSLKKKRVLAFKTEPSPRAKFLLCEGQKDRPWTISCKNGRGEVHLAVLAARS